MSLRAFFAKQSHHWEIATPQGERLRTGTWVLMSDFLSEGQFDILTTFIVIFYIVNGMFNDDGHLSPDLVWMLQSNQIDVDALTEALVASYYQQIYSSALARLTYPEEAHRAAQDTLIQVIVRKKEYRGNSKVRDWIESIAEVIITKRRSSIEKYHFLNPNLINSIRTHKSGDLLSDRSLQLANWEIISQLDSKKVSNSRRASLQLLGLASLAVLAVYFLFVFTNRMSDGITVENSTSTNFDLMSIVTDSENTSAGLENILPNKDTQDYSGNVPAMDSLTLQSSPEEIRERILSSSQLWSTMWADVIVTFNGPAGYVGSPFTERHQLWIDQVGGAFQIIGPPQGIPDSFENIIFSAESSPTRLEFLRTIDYAKLGSQLPWFSIKPETVFLFPYAINYLFNPIEKDLILDSVISVVSEEVIADREALVIELSSPKGEVIARLWLDSKIGISLKEQYFNPNGFDKVIIESSLRKIHFDDSTPTRRKRPENSTFASIEVFPGIPGLFNHSNASVPKLPMMGYPFRPPPSDFDLSEARITFTKADHQDLELPKTGEFHIFAETYFMGNVEIIDPLKALCSRSPDGTKIVIANWGILPADINDKVYWLDLGDLDSFQFSIPNTIINWTSISPDNQKIAVTGFDAQEKQNKFFLVDTNTGEFEHLSIQSGISSIAWSPDGREIAIMDVSFSPSDFKSSTRIRIFDVKNGAEKRRFIPNEVTQGAKIMEIPLEEWTAVFQLPLQDLSRCTLSPDTAQSDLVKNPPHIFNKTVAE
jgi:hypothetical protein